MTVKDFYEVFTTVQFQRMTPGTYATRKSMLRCHFLPVCGALQISAVTPCTINSIFEGMEHEGLAQNTVFGAYVAINAFFRLAMEFGFISENPAEEARHIKQKIKKS